LVNSVVPGEMIEDQPARPVPLGHELAGVVLIESVIRSLDQRSEVIVVVEEALARTIGEIEERQTVEKVEFRVLREAEVGRETSKAWSRGNSVVTRRLPWLTSRAS